jgi:hypothetical protein
MYARLPTPAAQAGDIIPQVEQLANQGEGKDQKPGKDRPQGLSQNGGGDEENSQADVDMKGILGEPGERGNGQFGGLYSGNRHRAQSPHRPRRQIPGISAIRKRRVPPVGPGEGEAPERC